MAAPFRFGVVVFATLVALSTVMSEDVIIRKPYIIHMSKSMKPRHFSLHEHWYASLVNEVTSGADEYGSLLLYTYDILLHGFAAKLTSAEAVSLETKEGCLAVIPSSISQIHTTHSPQFLGLNNQYSNLWPRSRYGKDVIVGMIDSGIWPESKSFRDEGLGPAPPIWKGECESGVRFNSSHCNMKIIGARYFFKGYEARYGSLDRSEYKSTRDSIGHGTHTASIVAGSPAAVSGFANGTATGMAPQARLAVYKAVWGPAGRGDESDIAAAMEKAVADGVDIISMSLGRFDMPFYRDSQAIAAFQAIQKGVYVSVSGGNSGPRSFTVTNSAPWMTTVGASSIDRELPPGLNAVRKTVRAPIVAAFSGRGPSAVYPDIIKPDVVAPGVKIIAAWTEGEYAILSGTSMSCPHVSGIAALLRGLHPSWSPAALKSALMTSAYNRDNQRQAIEDASTGEPADAYVLGAGHINPQAAMDPGFVFDTAPQDYIKFLCTLNYTPKQIGLLVGDASFTCPRLNPREAVGDLNYPSFSVHFNSTKLVQVKRRTVTNVGGAPAAYKVQVKNPPGVTIDVQPMTLKFAKQNERVMFTVRFEGKVSEEGYEFGEILWKSIQGGTHVVRSAVAVVWQDN